MPKILLNKDKQLGILVVFDKNELENNSEEELRKLIEVKLKMTHHSLIDKLEEMGYLTPI